MNRLQSPVKSVKPKLRKIVSLAGEDALRSCRSLQQHWGSAGGLPKLTEHFFIVTTESRGANLHLGMEQGLSREKGMEHGTGVPEAQHASLPSSQAGRCSRNLGRRWQVPRYRCLLLAPPSLRPRFFRKSNTGCALS